jgi:PilZ domain-containing protein
MQSERRAHRRIKMETPCWLGTKSKSTLLQCELRDISDGGAQIMLPFPAPLPVQVQLYLTKERTVARDAWVVWRQGTLVGLAFLDRDAGRKR